MDAFSFLRYRAVNDFCGELTTVGAERTGGEGDVRNEDMQTVFA
jgi:hypothetical protein